MALEDPLWIQSTVDPPTFSYSAREDRRLIDALLNEGVLTGGALLVSERAAGANNTVDVAIGLCVITGDDEANQGKYLCRSTAIENVAVTAAPGSLKRRDLIIARVRDSQAGGGDGPDDHDWLLEHVEGTDLDASDPDAPATPDSAIVLASLLRTAGDASVLAAHITDERPFATLLAPLTSAVETKYPRSGSATSGAAYALDFDLASIHDVTLDQACTFSFTDPPNGALVGTITLVLRSAGFGATFPASVKWAGGTAPTLSASTKADIITFTTFDGGTTWAAMLVQDFAGLGT